jgi:phosphoglycerate dehydrogenase-like enzyme
MAHRIIVGFEPHPGLLDAIQSALPGQQTEIVTATDDEALAQALPGADILFGLRLNADLMPLTGSLQWIQTLSAGVENLISPALIESDIVITNASGAHASQISEHVLAMLLAFARNLPGAYRAQLYSRWDADSLTDHIFELGGKTLGVVGLGDLGDAVAVRASAFGLNILAIRNRPTAKPSYVDEIFPPGDLPELLSRSDFVVDTLPLTPATGHFFAAAQFDRMRDTAYFFNAGRGGTVDQDALISALQSGAIAGAGLDVTDPEPLPPSSPLWKLPKVIITPHYSGSSPQLQERFTRIFLDNLVRFDAGEPLANVVNAAAGY